MSSIFKYYCFKSKAVHKYSKKRLFIDKFITGLLHICYRQQNCKKVLCFLNKIIDKSFNNVYINICKTPFIKHITWPVAIPATRVKQLNYLPKPPDNFSEVLYFFAKLSACAQLAVSTVTVI